MRPNENRIEIGVPGDDDSEYSVTIDLDEGELTVWDGGTGSGYDIADLAPSFD